MNLALLDALIDFDLWVAGFSLVITFLIAAFSCRAYLLTHMRKQLYFSFAFASIAGGLLLAFIFNLLVEFEVVAVGVRGYLPITYWMGLMLLAAMFATLVGYMSIFIINEELKSRKTIFLLYAFTLFAVLVSHDFYFMYHLTAFLILAMIFNHYYWNNRKHKTAGTRFSMLAFCGLFLSHAVMMFIPYNPVFYVLGHLVQLVSFGLLLAVFFSLWRGSK